VSGPHYVGSLVIRHELTDELLIDGGYIGYHVVTPWRRQGHATRMLTAGVAEARGIGLEQILLTCAPDNEASRKVIATNGGRLDAALGRDLRFWIDATRPSS
jgi:predicted acetyltransferase